jgi:pyruvate dehydrogenase E1 component alpha subunit
MTELYRSMLRIRMVEQAIAARYGEGRMRCPIHLSIGQEAVAVGVAAVLRPDDRVLSSHRCHAHYLACGGDLKAMIAELHGSPDGCNGGRGGSMHLQGGQLVASLPIVGSAIPLAVGMALADKLDGSDRVTVVFFGDAAVEEGAFHEAMNLAAVKRLRVLFVCEDNDRSIWTPKSERQPDRSLWRMAEAYGDVSWIGFDSDGTVKQIRKEAMSAVREIRSYHAPLFIAIPCYRWAEHCGPNPRADLVADWPDPLSGFTPPPEMIAEITAEIDEAFAACQ